MTHQKTRYKAVVDGHPYTIIGHEDKQHMDLVTKIVNEQLAEIRQLSPQVSSEQAAILLAINAVSDQLKKQEQLVNFQKREDQFTRQSIRVVELENRVKRIEALEKEAKEVLKKAGKSENVSNHVEAQQILNENRKKEIQKRGANK